MSKVYSHQETIFSLNSIANIPSNQHGTVADLESYARGVLNNIFSDAGIIALIGKWRLEWGPQVYQAKDSDVADNAMYVARMINDPTQIVVAISGTNPISAFGWITEDLMINPTVAWPYGSDAPDVKGKITHGTDVGLNKLLELKDNGKGLMDYLADQVSNTPDPLSITVTGHSLGGALSPAMGLTLLDTQGKAEGWDPEARSKISVLPSAGATPGDVIWRDYYDRRIGARTDRIWNLIDVVPHAWQISMLKEIPTLYAPTIPESNFIEALVKIARINSEMAGDLQQICPSVVGLPGKVDKSYTITIKNLILLLETLLANRLLDKLAKILDLDADTLALIKKVTDDIIKHLKGEGNKKRELTLKDILNIKCDSATNLQSNAKDWSDAFWNLLDFLIQMVCQHTTAYHKMMGVVAFLDIVSAIKEEMDQ